MLEGIKLIATFAVFLIVGRFFYHPLIEKLSLIAIGVLVFTISVWSSRSVSTSNILPVLSQALFYVSCIILSPCLLESFFIGSLRLEIR